MAKSVKKNTSKHASILGSLGGRPPHKTKALSINVKAKEVKQIRSKATGDK